jgi:hypothetical protein
MAMDRKHERQALRRIALLLFAFSALADRAAASPRPIRIAVLWLLRAVESIAWVFVAAVAEESGGARDIGDDAGRLARSFTALAELLADLARRDTSPPLPGRIDRLVGLMMRTVWNPAFPPETLARPWPDTS